MNKLQSCLSYLVVCGAFAVTACGGSSADLSEEPGAGDAATGTDGGTSGGGDKDSATSGGDKDTGATPAADTGTTPPPADTGTTPPPADTGTGGGGGSSDLAGKVNCGDKGLVCTTATAACCIAYNPISGSAYSCNNTCTGFGKISVPCDGPEDCTSGNVCCFRFDGSFSASAKCEAKTTCTGGTRNMAISCHTNADCPSSMTCIDCTDPGGAVKVKQCVNGGKCP